MKTDRRRRSLRSIIIGGLLAAVFSVWLAGYYHPIQFAFPSVYRQYFLQSADGNFQVAICDRWIDKDGHPPDDPTKSVTTRKPIPWRQLRPMEHWPDPIYSPASTRLGHYRFWGRYYATVGTQVARLAGPQNPSSRALEDILIDQYTYHTEGLIIHGWPLGIIAGLALTWQFLKRRQRVQTKNDLLCQHSGYDLRCSPHRCPECGNTRRYFFEVRRFFKAIVRDYTSASSPNLPHGNTLDASA